MADKDSIQYNTEEAKRRFESALKGARIAGHKPMESLTKKGPKVKRAAKKKKKPK